MRCGFFRRARGLGHFCYIYCRISERCRLGMNMIEWKDETSNVKEPVSFGNTDKDQSEDLPEEVDPTKKEVRVSFGCSKVTLAMGR